jgi:hypothetical protein
VRNLVWPCVRRVELQQPPVQYRGGWHPHLLPVAVPKPNDGAVHLSAWARLEREREGEGERGAATAVKAGPSLPQDSNRSESYLATPAGQRPLSPLNAGAEPDAARRPTRRDSVPATDCWSPPADNMRGTQAPPDGRESRLGFPFPFPPCSLHTFLAALPRASLPTCPTLSALAPRDAERRAPRCRPAVLQRRDRRAQIVPRLLVPGSRSFTAPAWIQRVIDGAGA